MTVQYTMPAVNAKGYVMPTNVSQDNSESQYQFLIQNQGSEPGNTIYRVKITGPDAITNIAGVSHSNTNIGMAQYQQQYIGSVLYE